MECEFFNVLMEGGLCSVDELCGLALCAGITRETTVSVTSRVSPGSRATLRCTENVSGENVQFTWSREDGSRIVSGGRFTIRGNSSEILEISPAEEGDSGAYICQAETTDQRTVTGRVTLVVGMFKCMTDFLWFVVE